MKLVVAHTPDPDDSFMFYAMFEGKIKCNFDYDQVVKDIETLNKESVDSLYDVTAISANGYAAVNDKYYLTSSGASFGISYGPIVVSRKDVDFNDAVIGIPGKFTSAYLLYRMFGKGAKEYKEMRFDKIPEAVLSGEIDAGIIIHDEQLTFQDKGLIKVLDLYEEWKKYAGDLPIPLGFNAIKKSLGKENAKLYKEDFENSIKYAMENETDAVRYSLKYARYADIELERKFIRMYVNDLSVDFGDKGRKALELYYKKATEMGLLKPFNLEIV
ncbi:ABC transporter substrate-binding protein [uncultured archaeon]|nr:ABC transporter substrate-binding protein [uncultured archaeon]